MITYRYIRVSKNFVCFLLLSILIEIPFGYQVHILLTWRNISQFVYHYNYLNDNQVMNFERIGCELLSFKCLIILCIDPQESRQYLCSTLMLLSFLHHINSWTIMMGNSATQLQYICSRFEDLYLEITNEVCSH